MKTFQLYVAETGSEVNVLSGQYEVHIDGPRAAVAERIGNFEALVFTYAAEDGEPGYTVNVLVANPAGLPDQWVCNDLEIDFWAAVNRVADVATMPLGTFVSYLSTNCKKIT